MSKTKKIKIGFTLILLTFILAMIFSSCGDKPSGKVTEVKTPEGGSYTIKEIDGCQYIEVEYTPILQQIKYSLTHKGNCNNPIHKKSEIDDQKTLHVSPNCQNIEIDGYLIDMNKLRERLNIAVKNGTTQ